ncbi:Protein of unknown function [Bacillus toyonensis]|nr:Protein of unknown function [Bacillus toyonensis]
MITVAFSLGTIIALYN